MAIPACFADLGKKASDLFADDFVFGRVKFSVKSKASNGVEMQAAGTSNTDTGKGTGCVEAKYEHQKYGVTVTEKWDTDNVLNTDIVGDNVGLDGLQLGFETMFIPSTGQKSGKFKVAYKRPHVHLTSDVEVDYIGSVWRSTGTASYGPYLAGFQGVYESSQHRLASNTLGCAYESTAGDFVLSAALLNGTECMGSLHQQITPKLDLAVQGSFSLTSTATNLAVGTRYQIDDDSFFKAKVNNRSHIGFAYGVNLRKGVKLVASAIFDIQNAAFPNHRVGLSMEFD